MTTFFRRHLILALTVVSLVAAACGGSATDDNAASGDDTTSAAADDGGTAPDPDQASDETAATDLDAGGETCPSQGTVPDVDDGSTFAVSSEGTFPLTISVDGVDVTVEEAPQRIVSLSPTGTEMLFAIGAGDQVVAVDSFSYYPEEAPVTDLSGFTPNVEAIAGFDPDLVLLSGAVEGIEVLGVPVMVQRAAADLPEVYTQIEQLGAVTGHLGEAAELVSQMQTDIDEIVASVPERDCPLTYFHELDPTLFSVTSTTFVGQMYALVGLSNVADAADADGSSFGYPQITEEYLVAADPDLVFLADTICCAETAETVAARPGWDALRAVQAGNVVELNDDTASRWGPRVVDLLRDVATAVNAVETVAG